MVIKSSEFGSFINRNKRKDITHQAVIAKVNEIVRKKTQMPCRSYPTKLLLKDQILVLLKYINLVEVFLSLEFSMCILYKASELISNVNG